MTLTAMRNDSNSLDRQSVYFLAERTITFRTVPSLMRMMFRPRCEAFCLRPSTL